MDTPLGYLDAQQEETLSLRFYDAVLMVAPPLCQVHMLRLIRMRSMPYCVYFESGLPPVLLQTDGSKWGQPLYTMMNSMVSSR